MKTHKMISVLLFLAISFSARLFGQTADMLELLLEKPELSWSEAGAFIQDAAETELLEKDLLPKNAAPGDTARLNGVALLLMKSFDIKGGIFYRIAKSPHHAYRELVYRGIIRGDTDPNMAVSGRQLLLMVSRLLSIREDETGEASI